jgi:hypothetical protein
VTNPSIRLDPALEEVLGDVARRPSGALFGFDRRRLVVGLMTHGLQASPRQAGLSSAERELLGAQRETAARLLLEAYRDWLEQDERGRMGYPGERRDPEEARALAAHLAESTELAGADDGAGAQALLRSVGTVGSEADPSRLLYASLRLVDCPTTRVYLAHDYIARGEPRSALRTVDQVVRCRPSPMIEHTAWQAAAVACEHLGRNDETFEHHERALRLCVEGDVPLGWRAVALLNVLAEHLRVGDRERLSRLAAELDSAVEPHHPAVEIKLRGIERNRGIRIDFPAETRELARRVRDDAGPATRRILDAIV